MMSIHDKKLGKGIVAVSLLGLNFFWAYNHLTTGIMWFVTALIGVAGVTTIALLINENKILQYFSHISLIVLCIHGPVYRVVVKLVSISFHMSTDSARANFLIAILVVAITMIICSVIYEVVIRIAPWIVGNRKQKAI